MNLPETVKQNKDLWVAGIVIVTGFLVGAGLDASIISSGSDTPTDPSQEAESAGTGENESIDEDLELVTNVSWTELEYSTDFDGIYYSPNSIMDRPNNTFVSAVDGDYFGLNKSRTGGLYFKQDRGFEDAKVLLHSNTTAQEIGIKTRFGFKDTEERLASNVRYYEQELDGSTNFSNYMSRQEFLIGQDEEHVINLNPPQGTKGITASFWIRCPCSGTNLDNQEVSFRSIEVYT